jgi:branched-chain amino acid transport system ATP-binding protein
LLSIKHLESGYGHLQVLWGISLEVSKGELVALLGPNGAGKTTTLRTIAGLPKPKAGLMTFKGRGIDVLPAHKVSRLGISLIPESLHLFTGMSVYENLLLGAYALPEAHRVRETMDYVFGIFPILAERQKQLAGTLSGGERRMLALGRGLISLPDLLLVDEPSLGLAPKMALAVFESLSELKRRGITTLLVEQNVHTTLQISDRSYVLEQGRIILEGASRELMENEHICRSYLGK